MLKYYFSIFNVLDVYTLCDFYTMTWTTFTEFW